MTPPRSTVTGRPLRLIPAPIVILPFHWAVSWLVLLNLSLTVAFLSNGGVMCSKFTICESSCSLMHLIALAGSGFVTMSLQVFFAALLFPWTVTKVMTMAVDPGEPAGASVAV